MSNHIFFVPRNDAELNAFIASMNAANGKYFDTSVGKKRSEKLRDCICEGIGFTNGGYQQLQAYWASMADDSPFKDKDALVQIKCLGELHVSFSAVFLKGFVQPDFMSWINKHFPSIDNQPVSEEAEYGGDTWMKVPVGQTTPIPERRDDNSLLIYFNGMVVGYAEHARDSFIFNAMLNALAISTSSGRLSYGSGPVSESYANYLIKCASLIKNENKRKLYASLRMSSMEESYMVCIDSASIKGHEITLRFGQSSSMTVQYCEKQDSFIIEEGKVKFDFLSFYHVGEEEDQPESGSLSVEMVKDNGSSKFNMNYIEHFGNQFDYNYANDDEHYSESLSKDLVIHIS